MKTCNQCGRQDCPLLAEIIVGRSAWLSAVSDCYRARLAPKKGRK